MPRVDLGPGETVVGYSTRKYRQTVRYSMGLSEMPETKTSMVQITTLHVSDAVAALDPGFAFATAMALNPMGQGSRRSKLEDAICALASILPTGFALITEQDTRIASGGMEMANASSMRVTELTRAQLPATAVAVPAGLTPTDCMAYMTHAMQTKP